jgi:hypothetical protein
MPGSARFQPISEYVATDGRKGGGQFGGKSRLKTMTKGPAFQDWSPKLLGRG